MTLPFTLSLPANHNFLRIGEIPELTANAIYPEFDNEPLSQAIKREGCRINHEEALDRAIDAEKVSPLNPLSYEPHTLPHGDARKRAVITIDEFRRFAETLQIEVLTNNNAPEPIGVNSIDWPYWGNLKEVKVWEAILLSFGVDPDGQDPDLEELGNPLIPHKEVQKRLRLLLDNLSDREFFSPGTINIGNPKLCGVKIPEFAAWCINKGIDIPGQLIHMGLPQVYAHQEKDKANKGRYTIEEAAHLIAQEAGEREKDILHKLKDAAQSATLPVYEPEKHARYEYGPNRASTVRIFYEEAYWDDLNTWLDKHEPRITWRFPDPTLLIPMRPDNNNNGNKLSKPLEATSRHGMADLFDPLPKAGIVKVFLVDKDEKKNADMWRTWFDRAARNGLASARTKIRPYKYDPFAVANWLVSTGRIERSRANRILANNLPPRSRDMGHFFTGDPD